MKTMKISKKKILSSSAFVATNIAANILTSPLSRANEIVDVPEPMAFNLIQGLGAKKGDLEINVLGEFPINGDGSVEWAPEVVYAIADGIALEFEVPFAGSNLESYKFAAQFTMGQSLTHQLIYGSQFIYETFVGEEDKWQFSGLVFSGKRFSAKNSAMFMVGASTTQSKLADNYNEALINITFFHEYSEKVTLGLENDVQYHNSDQWSLLVMPQVHYQLPKDMEIQIGIGVEFNDSYSSTDYVTGIRLVKNYSG